MKTPQIKLIREYKKNYPLNYDSDTRQAQAWFGEDEKNLMVWMKYVYHRKTGRVELWTIETKSEYRNQGLSKQALEALKSHYGVDKIHHSGGYTRKGSTTFPIRLNGFPNSMNSRKKTFVPWILLKNGTLTITTKTSSDNEDYYRFSPIA